MRFHEWRRRVLSYDPRNLENTPEDDVAFVDLIYQMEGSCSSDVIDVLLQIFSDKPDYGIQESVAAVLASADPSLYIRRLLEHLEKLERRVPEWTVILMSGVVQFHSKELVKEAKNADKLQQRKLIDYLLCKQDDFAEYSPNAVELAERIAKGV